MTEIAAWTFVAIIAVLALFQLALAAGAPLGRFAFGGAHRRLRAWFRLGSLISIFIYAACGAIILDRARLVHLIADDASRTGSWVVSMLLTLSIVMNAISRSRPERFTMTPVALVLAICAYVVAMS